MGDAIGTIFCATDFSKTAELALRHATRLALDHDAKLVVGHAIEPLPVDPYPMPMAMSVKDNETAIRELATERLDEVAESIESEKITVETILDMGVPGPTLVKMAATAGADLVIIGTRGLTGIKHLALGSTAEYVVRRAPCPVLTVHPEDESMLDAPWRVVLPTDLSEDAEVAIETFIDLFGERLGAHAPSETQVDIVFVDSTPPYLEGLSHERLARYGQPDARRDEVVALIQPTREKLEAKGFQVSVQVLDGAAVPVVTAYAESRQADLIVMSTHGRSAIMNALLGRTAQRIVQHAHCPVLTVCPAKRR